MDRTDIIMKLNQIKAKGKEMFKVKMNEMNLTPSEFELLNYIYYLKRGNIPAKASLLAEAFYVSIPAIMHKLQALEEKKLVYKTTDSVDKRIKFYSISKDLEEVCHKMRLYNEKVIDQYIKYLGEEANHLNIILDMTIDFLEVKND